MRRRIGSLVAMAILPISLFAQRVNTTITGTITDPSGAAIPQAQVTAVRSLTGAKTTAQSDIAGFYVLTNLEPSTYDLRVEKTGFESYVRPGVVLQADRPVTVNVSMTIGSQLQSVTVSGEAPQVDVRDQTLTTTVTPEMAQDLPLNGRNILQLMSVAPDVSPSVPPGSYSYYAQQAARPEIKGVFFSASGGRGNSSGFYLDGGVNEDPYDQIANIFPNPDAIQEFSYHTSSYSARFGGRGGGVVNAVTRGGTNQFHGSAFEFVRNGTLNARNFFASENDGLKRNQYGFTIGGPVHKDKTFFFLSWQGTNVRSRPTQNESRTATAAERAGDFSEIPTQLVNPETGQPFPNNQIPTSSFDPIAQKILALVPVGAPGTGLVFYGTRLEQNDKQWVSRVDHNFGSRFRLYGRYLYDYLDQPGHSRPDNLLTAAEDYYWKTQNLTLNAAYTLRPNLLVTVTGTFNRIGMISTGPKGLPGLTQLGANVPNLVTEGSKTSLDFGISGYFSSFWDGVYRYPRNEFEYENNWTYIRGGHTLEFGGNIKLHERTLRDQDYVSDGYFDFSAQLTGDNLADFMLGKSDFFEQYQPAYGNLSRVAPALFVADTWKATRRLTLDLGVRWDPWIPSRDISANNGTVMFDPKWFYEGRHSTRYPNMPAGLLMADDPGIPDTGMPAHYPVFDPRIGFAYDLFGNGKTSIRAGFGIYHDEPYSNAFAFGVGGPPTSEGVSFYFPKSLENPYEGQFNPFPAPTPVPPSFPFPIGTAMGAYSPDVRQPTIQQWNFTVEHQLTPTLLLRVAYQGSESYHMYTGIEGNGATYIPGASTLENVQSRRPITQLGFVIVGKTLGTNSFNALTITAEKRLSHGLTFLGGFRWSKSLDEASQSDWDEDINNPYIVRASRGLSDYDVSKQFNLSYVWAPPVPESFGTPARQVLGNWRLNGILSLRAGFPYSIYSGIDNALIGAEVNIQRADLTGQSPNLPSNRPESAKLSQWFNPSAFTSNAIGTFGNSPRNAWRGPGFANLDFALVRSFPIRKGPFKETQRLDFRAESFNIFNRANFQNPESDSPSITDGPLFGTILGAADPRILQFALKFIF